MYNLEQLEQLIRLDQVDSHESLFESLSHEQFTTKEHARLCIDLVDCEPSNY